MHRTWMASVAGGALAASFFAGYLMLRAQGDLASVAEDWAQVVAAGVVGALLTLAGIGAAYLRYRRRLHQLGMRLNEFRKHPSGQSLLHGFSDGVDELKPLLVPVDELCAAYRKALADRVAQDQTLESLRDLLGQTDPVRGQRQTVRGGSSRNMVARLTPNLYWMAATPALQEYLRCKAGEINARPFAEVIHPEDMPTVERGFREALDSGEVHNVGFRLVPRGGNTSDSNGLEERYVTMDVVTRLSEEGKPLHFRCFLVDVGDRERAERELRRRTQELVQTNDRLRRTNQDLERLKESYRDLYHLAPVMYFSLDAAGQFVTFNETLLRALGYRREDLWKQPYTRLLAPDSLRTWKQGAAEPAGQAEGGRPLSHALTHEGEVETQWVKKDGTIIDVWIRSVPVEDERGQFVRSRSAALDVTERNRLANELRARRDELERANADLLVINRELEEFTSVVSHDLKEPLRTLQAFSGFLAEDFSGQLGPDGFHYINHLVQASRRLGTLIEDLLTLSGVGRITHNLQTFDLIEIVAVVRRDLSDLMVRKQADVVVEGSLPTVIGDPQRITQLLTNLFGNGLKYNTSPVPKVTIGQVFDVNGGPGPASGPGKKAHPQVTLYVRDNGIGIDPRYHEQIFGIFRRLHRPEEYEGTGAGLAICKKIVEAHAGRIWVDSAPGQGSTFFFTLPLAPPESPEDLEQEDEEFDQAYGVQSGEASEPAGQAEVAAGRSSPAQLPARLLLVEDMSEIGLIAQKLAQRAGHELTWLKTAEDAWQYLQQERPDLALLDVHLPGMSGDELCRRLRTLPHLADLPIALFTQGHEDPAWVKAAGADYILSKDLLCQPEVWQRRLADILRL
jgi:PAS domain S-box-containing protein